MIIERNSLALELAFLAKTVVDININLCLGSFACIIALLSRRQCRLLDASVWKATNCVRGKGEEECINKDEFEILLAILSKSGATETALYVFKTKIINDIKVK